jgi:hypothetical protein
MGAVTLDPTEWKQKYPQYSALNDGQVEDLFFAAQMYLENTALSVVSDETKRKYLLYLLTAHIAWLIYVDSNGDGGPGWLAESLRLPKVRPALQPQFPAHHSAPNFSCKASSVSCSGMQRRFTAWDSTGVAMADKVMDALNAIASNVESLQVKAGFIDGATYPDGTPVAMVAAVDEWRSSQKPATRPFFRNAIAQH